MNESQFNRINVKISSLSMSGDIFIGFKNEGISLIDRCRAFPTRRFISFGEGHGVSELCVLQNGKYTLALATDKGMNNWNDSNCSKNPFPELYHWEKFPKYQFNNIFKNIYEYLPKWLKEDNIINILLYDAFAGHKLVIKDGAFSTAPVFYKDYRYYAAHGAESVSFPNGKKRSLCNLEDQIIPPSIHGIEEVDGLPFGEDGLIWDENEGIHPQYYTGTYKVRNLYFTNSKGEDVFYFPHKKLDNETAQLLLTALCSIFHDSPSMEPTQNELEICEQLEKFIANLDDNGLSPFERMAYIPDSLLNVYGQLGRVVSPLPKDI
jgi:hypothetical protein